MTVQPFSDPITGGGILVQPEIRSPGYVPGVSGWIIRADGSAEFHGLTVTGGTLVIEGAGNGLFAYSGAPASGNLIASIAAASATDPHGNAYISGFASYSAGTLAAVLNAGLITWFTAASPAGPWSPAAQIELSGQVGAAALPNIRVNGIFGIEAVTYVIAPSGDTTGATDTTVISAALASGACVQLTPGTFYLNSQVTVAGTTLAGSGFGTVIRPNTTGTAYTGALLAAGAKSWITGLTVSNSASDAITVAGGIAEWWLTDLNFASCAGWCVNATITGPAHGRIRGIRGQGGGAANGGGINLNGGAAGAKTAEINLSDIDIQNCQSLPVLQLSAVTDIRSNGPFNGSMAAAAAQPCISVQGACQSCDLGSVDVGGGAAAGVLIIQDAGGNSPTEIQIGPGVVQSGGGAGVVVSGSAARLSFDRLMSKRNQGDGWLFSGTGAFITLDKCGGNLNNQAAGVAYDIEVTSTAHILNDGFSYVSGGVTAGRSLAAGNHYTEANPPSALTSAGAAPAGW